MSDGEFLGYILLLAVSGIICLTLAIAGFGQSVGARVLDALFGAGFLGYAIYLFAFFEGGEVRILFYAFIVPILAIVQAVKAARRKADAKHAAVMQGYAAAQQGQAPPPAYPPAQPGAPVAQPQQPGAAGPTA